MKLAVFASILTLGAAPALAASVQNLFPARRCGDTHFDAAVEARNQQLIQAYSQKAVLHAPRNRSVPVYWHTITDGATGPLTPSQIQAQIDVLNQDYAKSGYVFHLADSDSTSNPDWFHNLDLGQPQERAMKTSLHRGSADALNFYTVGFDNGELGFAMGPFNYSTNPWRDGVVINYGTLPGGHMAPFNLGRTATHEVGHWLGLFHVFEGGCSGGGDLVDDTPPQSRHTFGCPSSQDSCAGGGADSIHNFMDYSIDSCMNEFTKGQNRRMHALTLAYRGL
ncbi:unnamed protein product [Tilletia controversa]|uniref:Peptidase M43 pregnancy-associated plasma-A domain-containing protein n=1 Tax=Tilletia controversa TaxID=13291 RepID=A0A8X7SVF8_9BASI|nr:hypothetical protein CF328_g5128 [Tilletia controversa]KAE8244939.1 hypothetical protein A4X06_0g5897 [Tilletia controversa]CAD6936061.1 unnamed protein product [Tilletia controversa]CAD6969371.1 unnamed protein product [Tilletia controversa]